ncbi:hypothetical protein HZR81_12095 [Pseudomonas sp. LM13]
MSLVVVASALLFRSQAIPFEEIVANGTIILSFVGIRYRAAAVGTDQGRGPARLNPAVVRLSPIRQSAAGPNSISH